MQVSPFDSWQKWDCKRGVWTMLDANFKRIKGDTHISLINHPWRNKGGWGMVG